MAVPLLFFVNAGILFYIALIVSYDLHFCKINGIKFCFGKKIFTPKSLKGTLQEFKILRITPESQSRFFGRLNVNNDGCNPSQQDE